MDYAEFEAMVAPLRENLAHKAGAGRGDLRSQLVRSDRLISGRGKRAGRILVEAETMLAHPKMRLFVDEKRVRRAARILDQDVRDLSLWDRRMGYVLSFLGTIAFMILVMVAVGLWLGYGRS